MGCVAFQANTSNWAKRSCKRAGRGKGRGYDRIVLIPSLASRAVGAKVLHHRIELFTQILDRVLE